MFVFKNIFSVFNKAKIQKACTASCLFVTSRWNKRRRCVFESFQSRKKTFLSTQEYIRAQYKSSHLEARRHFRLYSACNIHDYFCSDSSFGAKCQLPQTSASVVTSVLGAASILLKKANLKTNLPNHFHKIMFFLTVSFSFKSILISIIVFFNTG